MADQPSQLKYAKPKILLIDMPEECERVLRDAGYNVSMGSFGIPYSVERSDNLRPISLDTSSLPNYEEQEIIVANTACPKADADPPTNAPGRGVDAFWQDGTDGEIDPRPFCMYSVSAGFQRILQHGGIFIVFLSARYTTEYVKGALGHGGVRKEDSLKRSNWSFLEPLESFNTQRHGGLEIEFFGEPEGLRDLLKRGSDGAYYECVISPYYGYEDRWVPLAKNKYGRDVAGLLLLKKPEGCILLLPQMPNAHAILVRLLEGWCTRLNPKLFPEFEGSRWIHRQEYEIPDVNLLRQEIEETRQAGTERISDLEEQIRSIQQANSDWYTLLNGTGDELVGAVIRSLERLGFKQVVDVDEQAKQKGDEQFLGEDIQIRDQSPVLIVDVKGVAGHPEDAEATQSEKHALMRADEFGGRVKPLTIINHQRNMPPHDRDQQAYRNEIVDNARKTNLGLMTTWDLFRLLRNKDSLGWPDNVVKCVFYRTGRIEPIPEHYCEVGTIVHVWEKAFGIIPKKPIMLNVRLAIEVGDLFEEVLADSLQVDGADVEEAPPGSNCGIGYDGASSSLREKMRVFLVKQP